MSQLDQHAIARLSRRLQEPAWLAELRVAALKRHGELAWPHPSDEVWRRTDVTQLDPTRGGFALAEDPGLLASLRLTDAQLARCVQPLGEEHLNVRADGAWVSHAAPPGAAITDLAEAAQRQEPLLQQILGADGLTEPEQKLETLNAAFHHDDCVISIPAGLRDPRPIRLVRLISARPNAAVFPLTVITVGRGSSVVLIDEYVGLPNNEAHAPHIINGRTELVVEPEATVHYIRLQRWDAQAHEFFLQRATLQEGARLVTVNINMGARISKTHAIVKLLGPHADSRLYGFVFGHGRQHVDQHTLQDHQAPHTFSDLLYKAALKDDSRMIYTGLIRIAKAAKQTNAYQANHNLLLGRKASAETIPMLEILADDVQCKHGATIGPVDEEQLFYLTTRGIARELAERVLVMGFVEPIIEQIPLEALRVRLREELEGSL